MPIKVTVLSLLNFLLLSSLLRRKREIRIGLAVGIIFHPSLLNFPVNFVSFIGITYFEITFLLSPFCLFSDLSSFPLFFLVVVSGRHPALNCFK